MNARDNAAVARPLLVGVFALSAIFAATPAFAQNVLFSGADIRANPLLPESKGIKLGEGRLHPFLELDAHHIYNAGRFSEDAYSAGIDPSRRSDFYFVIRPGVDYKLPSPKLDLSATAYVERQQYIENTDFSSWQGGLGSNLHYNKDGPLQLRLSESLTRTAAPGNQTFTRRFDHWTNNTSVGVDVTPGGGALKLSADMTVFFDAYDNSQVDSRIVDNQRYTPALRAAWSFLPKTQIFAEATTTFTNFSDDSPVPTFANADSWIYSGFVGINGAITPKISTLAKVGYTGLSADPVNGGDRGTNTVGAQAEVAWQASALTKLRLGGVRMLEPTSVFIFATMWKAYMRFDQAIASRVNVSVGAEYQHLRYARSIESTGGASEDGDEFRSDDNLMGSIAIAYYLSEFITLSIVDRVDIRGSNYLYDQIVSSSGTTQMLPTSYTTNDLFFRVGIRY